MKKYKAVFTVPAELVIELEVTAENQQEGMVLAHDAIKLATVGQARIVHMDLSGAFNASFDPLSVSAQPFEAVPPSPLSLGTSFTVLLFTQDKCVGEPAISNSIGAYAGAKALAESVLQADSPYGSASVLDQLGTKVLEVQAPRGGWEAEVIMAEAGDKAERYSWLESFAAAKATALLLVRRKGSELVRITDYTDRKKGPVLKKEIR